MPVLALAGLLAGCGGAVTSWGPEAAEDGDPSDEVEEYALEAGESTQDWGFGDTPAWTYNGQSPGPLLQTTLGHTLRVQLENDLPDQDTTIHWHGLRVPNDQDGVTWVQQPLAPGDRFTYEFTPPDAGTYWYHPHVNSPEQIERGLYGPLVVLDPDDPEVGTDRVLVLDDVDLEPDGTIAPFNADESAINSLWGRYGNVLLLNGQSVLDGPVRASADSGRVERWRLVNATNARAFTLRVDGADWRLIAEDGGRITAPQQLDQLTLISGERLELEVLPGREDVTLTLLIQPPDGEPIEYPAFVATADHRRDPAEPLDWPAPTLPDLEEPQQEITLNFTGEEGDGNVMTWMINGQAWMDCEDHMGGDMIPLEQDTPTRITLVNDSDVDHPFHLHGQLVQIVSVDGEAPAWRGQRDTVLVAAGQTVVLYSLMDNPGMWMAHCHILEHVARGMMTAFEVGETP